MSHPDQTLKLEGFDELMKLLGEMRDLTDPLYAPIRNALNQAGQMVERTAKENLTANNSVAFGHLRASIGSQMTATADSIVVQVGTNLGQTRNRRVGYGPAVEFGTVPHAVPLDDLYQWVRVKKMAGKYALKTRRRMGNKAQQLQEDMTLAREIQMKIRFSGTRAQPYLLPAMDSNREEIVDLVDKAVDQVLKNFSKK